MVDVRGIVGDVAGLLLVAARSFLLTLLLMLLLGGILAVASYWILSGPHWVYGVVAALVALDPRILNGQTRERETTRFAPLAWRNG
jgi:hypothetical protein